MRHRTGVWIGRTIGLTLLVIAGFTTWLIIANRAGSPAAPRPAAASTAPDYTLEDAVVTRYDPQGRPRYVLDAATIAHMPVSGASVLSHVKLDYAASAGSDWRVTADRGRLAADDNHLRLVGHVFARELDRPDPLRISAPEARIELDRRIVRSADRVRLWQTGYQTEGTGLYADLQSDVVNLLHQVDSRFAR